jgi:hypothetical protein
MILKILSLLTFLPMYDSLQKWDDCDKQSATKGGVGRQASGGKFEGRGGNVNKSEVYSFSALPPAPSNASNEGSSGYVDENTRGQNSHAEQLRGKSESRATGSLPDPVLTPVS